MLLAAQVYSLSFYGIAIGEVIMDSGPDALRFSARSEGLLNMIWPFQNDYKTRFDPGTYTVREYMKTIRQKEKDFTLSCTWDDNGIYTWSKGDTLRRPQGMENIFSMLARIQQVNASDIDTRWYILDHEGQCVRARFLWANTVRVFVRNDSILCDYYRLDLEILPRGRKISEEQDYFMKYISERDLIRQIWVEREEPRRIIKALVSRGPLKLEALLQNE